MDKTIVGLYVPVKGKPETREIPDDLTALQELVEGYIETDRVLPGVVAIVNEEGMLLDKPRNRGVRGRMYFGNVFFARVDGEAFVSLTTYDLAEIQAKYLREPIIPGGKGMTGVWFVVLGDPQGKARPRVVSGHAYTPKNTARYERSIRMAYPGAPFPDKMPLEISIHAVFSVPKSASKKARTEMLAGKVRPTKKPDCDNIGKAVMDALNRVAYHDDAQIVCVTIDKVYGEVPCLIIELRPAEKGETNA